MRRAPRLNARGLLVWALLAIAPLMAAGLTAADAPKRLDPAAWGSDHVGQPIPGYMTGDECLFCHRDKIGTTWGGNRHNLTIRPFDETAPARTELKRVLGDSVLKQITLVLGDQHQQRFLRPAKAYGKLDLLSTAWTPPHGKTPGKMSADANPHWDETRFAEACAGCHTTAVDPKEQAFSALSLDCFTCHGNVSPDHTKRPALAYLSPRRKDEARVVTSICAQCHVRTGKSRSTGRPYSTSFVAGDNLFRDFQVDFSERSLADLSTADRHVLANVRDVAVLGQDKLTCLSCHDVHGRSTAKHHRLARTDYCTHCHNAEGPKKNLKGFSVHSKTCGY
jgi:hypothetical protein